MIKKLQQLRDRLTIWAIYRFNIQLPDLLRTDNPRPGRIYYYYGRWLKLVPHSQETAARLRRFRKQHDMFILNVPDHLLQSVDRLNEKMIIQKELANIVCEDCAIRKLAIPCKKKHNTSIDDDTCLTHTYKLIKGKNHEEI